MAPPLPLPAPPPRSSASSSNSSVQTAYSLSLLSEYTHALDSVPLDLARNFADLRELDAVLSSSLSTITSKIYALIRIIFENNPSTPKEERLWLLNEIAEEAGRLKLGGEDKIRVACQAADNLKSHSNYIRSLLESLPGFDTSVLRRRTTYPHIATRNYMPAGGLETGRRRRGGYGSLLTGTMESPSKRKRVPKEDDADERVNGRSPRKEKAADGSSRNRNAARKRHDRAASPADSAVSVTSYLPSNAVHHEAGTTHSRLNQVVNNQSGSRSVNNPSSSSKRSRPNNNSNANLTLSSVMEGAYDRSNHTNGASSANNANANGTRRDMFNAPPAPSTSHPSLMYSSGSTLNASSSMHYERAVSHSQSIASGTDWPAPTQLEGPGMPVARPLVFSQPAQQSHAAAAAAVAAVEATSTTADAEMEGEDDLDNRRYCVCNGVSYGEMIACDDNNCEQEWFHLGCLDLTAPPSGRWFCEACKARKNAKRSGRGGKRKSNNARSGGRAVANGS